MLAGKRFLGTLALLVCGLALASDRPDPDLSTAAFYADAVRGTFTDAYATGFEPGDGFSVGFLGGQSGWTEFVASAVQPTIEAANPNGGAQHMRIAGDPGLEAGTLIGGFSPLITVSNDMVPSTVEIDVFISESGGASYDIAPQTPAQGFLTARLRFDALGSVLLQDGDIFFDTGADWTPNQWINVRIEINPGNSQIHYFLDDALIYSADELLGGTTVEQVVVLSDNAHTTDFADFDNLDIRLKQLKAVTKTADSNDGVCDADCSLREAIAAAVNGPEDDLIVFDSGVFGSVQTITLSNGELLINPNGRIEIDGPGADLLTIDGNAASRIFSVNEDAVVVIDDLTLTNGNGAGSLSTGSGGAILNNGGNLTLKRMVLKNNSSSSGGGGLSTRGGGVTWVEDTLFEGNLATSSGGGLQNFSTSTLTVINSTFHDNETATTVGGGGAQINGTATIINSTFSGNRATAGSGGGLSSNGSFLLMVNNTFAQNTSLLGGGGFARRTTNANAFLRNNLFTDNNSQEADQGDVSTTSTLNSLGNNLVSDPGLSIGWIESDLLDVAIALGPLMDNGGETPTHATTGGSATTNGGQNCVLDQTCDSNNLNFDLTYDQRRFPRSQIDIGAFEWGAEFIFTDQFEQP